MAAGTKKKKTSKKTPLGIAFGAALKWFRLRRKLSQEALGHACGFDRATVSLLERGVNQPNLRTVFLLAKELKVTPDALVAKTRSFMAEQKMPAKLKGLGRRTRRLPAPEGLA